MPSDAPAFRNSRGPVGTLGVLWIVYGIIRLGMAVWLAVFTPTATVMFGALLTRVPDPFTLMSAFHFLYLVMVIWSAVCGVFGIVGGLALLAGQRSAPSLALVAAFLSLSEIPLGVTLGIYTLIVFLPPNPARTYVASRQAA
jgi:hypothetical protein